MTDWRQFRKFEAREFVLCAVDTASGGIDYTSAQFLSKTRIDIPLVFQSKVTTSDFLPSLDRCLQRIYEKTGVKPVVALERNNGGSFLMDRLAGLNLHGKYEIFTMPNFGDIHNSEPRRLGFDMNSATRPKALQDLKDAIDKHVIQLYDEPTINELFSFIVMQTNTSWKAQAERGSHDDLVMALAIVWQMYQMCNNPVSNWDEPFILPDDTRELGLNGSYY